MFSFPLPPHGPPLLMPPQRILLGVVVVVETSPEHSLPSPVYLHRVSHEVRISHPRYTRWTLLIGRTACVCCASSTPPLTCWLSPQILSLIFTTTRLTFFFISNIFPPTLLCSPRDSAHKLETESGIETELDCGRDFREAVLSGDWCVSGVSLSRSLCVRACDSILPMRYY